MKQSFKPLSATLALLLLLSSCSFSTGESSSTQSSSDSGTTDTSSVPSEEFGSGVTNSAAMPPPWSGQSNANVSINAASSGLAASGKVVSESGNSYTSTNADESAVVASSGGTITLKNATIVKSGDGSNNENSEFYGLNAALIAKDSSTITLSDSTVTTSSKEANAVFATSKSTVNVSNVTIKTTGDSGARGLDATYGATINADKVNITTAGAHSAAIATDRGEGNVNITNSTLETNGTDSPAIYSTGKFKVTDTTGTANSAEAAVIEGQNSITLLNSILVGAKNWGVMIYQSFSGDAQGTGGVFTMENGSLTAKAGPLFYSTNTVGYINLKNVILNAVSGVLLKAEANSRWGSTGSNGSTVTLVADTQTLSGNILADSISVVNLSLKNNSRFSGAIDAENAAKSANISLDASSIWNVTGDSHINTISGAIISGENITNIIGNGHNVYYSSSENSSLGGKTYTLPGGGQLIAE